MVMTRPPAAPSRSRALGAPLSSSLAPRDDPPTHRRHASRRGRRSPVSRRRAEVPTRFRRVVLYRLACSARAILVVLGSVLASAVRADEPAAASRPGAPGAQGKIVLIQGHVDRAVANQPSWDPAKVFQELFVGDRVRTLGASRTAILFIDETQVKLNAGAILSV